MMTRIGIIAMAAVVPFLITGCGSRSGSPSSSSGGEATAEPNVAAEMVDQTTAVSSGTREQSTNTESLTAAAEPFPSSPDTASGAGQAAVRQPPGPAPPDSPGVEQGAPGSDTSVGEVFESVGRVLRTSLGEDVVEDANRESRGSVFGSLRRALGKGFREAAGQAGGSESEEE